jgi:TonB family protein
MYFDFEDYRPAEPTLGHPISRREGVLLSIILHLLSVVALLLYPELPFVKEAARRAALEAERQQAEALERQRDARTFVFVEPRVDRPAPKPPVRGPASDIDRMAQAPRRAPEPRNPLPFARGNSAEPVESEPEERARGRGPAPEPSEARRSNGGAAAGESPPSAVPVPNASRPGASAGEGVILPPSASAGGSLGDALRNLQRFVQRESFDNPQGGAGQFGPSIQFDTKGVEFGPWIRRFVAQIKRNWFIPYAAMAMKGHVVVTFNVHKNGAITDLTVVGPSSIDAFNNSAFNALAASNPTQPLPPEYPADRAFFTVTFYYNESPPTTP